jgi:signal peptidase I
MLPHLQRDDLVLIRPAREYRVGDAVAYESTLLHRVVLHRIVAISGGRYTFKGDNNSWLDPERVPVGRLVGKRWVRVPRLGNVARAVRTPAVAAALASLLVLVWGLGGGRPAPSETQ